MLSLTGNVFFREKKRFFALLGGIFWNYQKKRLNLKRRDFEIRLILYVERLVYEDKNFMKEKIRFSNLKSLCGITEVIWMEQNLKL